MTVKLQENLSKNNNKAKQQGYSLLVLLLLISLAGASYFYSKTSHTSHKLEELNQRVLTLNKIKQRLLRHSNLAPQIYATHTNKKFLPPDKILSPGYFPCPDTNGNGSANAPCGMNQKLAYGRLPISLGTRHFDFLSDKSLAPYIWYIVDSRFVTENTDFDPNGTRRFAPLNPQNPSSTNLKFGQDNNLVLLLYWPLDNSKNPNSLNLEELSQQNAITASISHNEWAANLYQTIIPQQENLCQISATAAHWFNNCSRDNSVNSNCTKTTGFYNPTGSNWRELLCKETPDLP